MFNDVFSNDEANKLILYLVENCDQSVLLSHFINISNDMFSNNLFAYATKISSDEVTIEISYTDSLCCDVIDKFKNKPPATANLSCYFHTFLKRALDILGGQISCVIGYKLFSHIEKNGQLGGVEKFTPTMITKFINDNNYNTDDSHCLLNEVAADRFNNNFPNGREWPHNMTSVDDWENSASKLCPLPSTFNRACMIFGDFSKYIIKNNGIRIKSILNPPYFYNIVFSIQIGIEILDISSFKGKYEWTGFYNKTWGDYTIKQNLCGNLFIKI